MTDLPALSPTAASDPTATPAPMTSAPFVGMLSGDEASQPGPATAETTLGESLESAFQSAPTPVWTAAAEASRYFADTGSFDYTNMGGGVSYWPDSIPRPQPPGQHIAAADADEQAKAAGATLKPFAPGTMIGPAELQGMISDSVTANKNADIINRSAAGIVASPARAVAGILGSMVDPANLMSLMVPGAPEAWVARGIEGLGEGALARAAVHGAVGAAQGAIIGASTVPLQAAVASQDQQDFSWGQALRDTLFQAAIGAGAGVFHGLLGRPETTEAVMKGALSRVMEDHPQGVDIQGILDHADATDAADRLDMFQRKQAAIDAERATLQPGQDVNRAGDIAEAQGRIADAYDREKELRGEAARVPTDTNIGRVDADPETAARLAEIDKEMAGTIPRARRASLEQEREMLTEGLHAGVAARDVSISPEGQLEQARNAAQAEGLTAAADRARAAGQAAETDLARIRNEEAAAQAARTSSDRATRIRQLQLDGTEAATQAAMEKEIRRYAYKTADAAGTPLAPGEAATIAREIRTAGPGEVRDIIANHLNALARRSDAFPVRDSLDRAAVATRALRREALGAATDMAARIQNPGDPELDRAHEALARTAAAAPKLEGDVAKETTEAMQSAADRKAEYDDLVASGQAHELPSLEAAGKDYDEFAKGIETFAKTCGYGE